MSAPAAAAAAAAGSNASAVLGTYRTLAKLVRRLPEKQQAGAWTELRDTYRKNMSAPEERVQDLMEEAGKKIAYLRIVTPKDRHRYGGDASSKDGTTRWVYKADGKEADGKGTPIKASRVVSNWSGTNMDPCSVKRHTQQLKRAGFVNNLHAKGLF